MVVWSSLIGGIIIGWLIEWLIDWLYWRRGAEAFYTMEQELRQELAATRRELEEAQAVIAQFHQQSETRQPEREQVAPARPSGNGGEARFR
jgi:hypothetical protein